MTLHQRLKSTAQELIRLLEESQKEHQEFIKERDTRLGVDPWAQESYPIVVNVLVVL